ncbi:MAG: L-histidine N(alpha)-methyltransferase, partial [Chitinophagales bacterium]|nr:L-histidine N(alpha)-methyltransferase [Hyphomicrobiales bacterium]
MTIATRSRVDSAPLDDFAESVLDGLSQSPKAIPCRFFYDERGSELFEAITRLDEYYPTRTEITLLEQHAGAIAELAGPRACIIEFGSGSSRKTGTLIAAMDDLAVYAPIDICREALDAAAERLARQFPDLPISPICADFNAPISLPKSMLPLRKLGFFPGSTIGNLHPDEAVEFLRRAARLLGRTGALLVGVDLRKSADILIPAYDDAQGVTAEFNLNLLARINRELDGNLDIAAFEHEAIYNEAAGRIEIYMKSLRQQTASVLGQSFSFDEGERVHTENSYKYSVEGFRALANEAGWRPEQSWVDTGGL